MVKKQYKRKSPKPKDKVFKPKLLDQMASLPIERTEVKFEEKYEFKP